MDGAADARVSPIFAAAGQGRRLGWWHNAGMADDIRTQSPQTAERMEVQRTIPVEPSRIFALLRDPKGHVTIDSSGMLQDSTGEPASKVGDEFVIHMDRESLNDYPMGQYDVTVTITAFEPDREIAWTILGQIKPQIGHVYGYTLEPVEGGTLVTSYYDWSDIDPQWKDANIFPVIPETALRATLGILERTLAHSTQVVSRAAPSREAACGAQLQSAQRPSIAKWCGSMVKPKRVRACLASPSNMRLGDLDQAPALLAHEVPVHRRREVVGRRPVTEVGVDDDAEALELLEVAIDR